ncbi:hypothetical protein ES689_15280 [Frigoribacterium sp. ACAM 257]|uniref:hypothetical protein n=1 Tax=Frigoribacterium sp. ACAM 257 TaxID=2508998 RepID=UPI0011B98D22|nr:hypothetical protein [Frigoribacterium sp. ACAM 257]TWX34028.1 hypothetical protein ES689_15280 [Frigoribacterium sp. ACAM 257]
MSPPTASWASLLVQVVTITLGTVLYALSLHWVYAHLITVPFAYAGFTYRAAAPQLTIATLIFVCAVAVSLPARPQRVSHVVLWVLFVVGVAPAMLMVAYTGYLGEREAAVASATIGLAFGTATVGTRVLDARAATTGHVVASSSSAAGPTAQPHRRFAPGTAFWAICGLHSALTYGVMAATTGLSLRFVALADVYDVRAVYKEEVQGGSGLLGYLLSGQANVVNTAIMARGITSRNVPLIAAGVIGQLVLYSGTGFKTILFSFPAVLVIAFATQVSGGRARAAGLAYVVAPVALMVVAAVADELQGGIVWTSLFARRFLITPGVLTSAYVNFFGEHPPAVWGRSFLRWWVDSPYDRSIALEVGQYLQPGGALAANANLFADGFANLGHVGVIGTGVALLAFLRFVDRTARDLPLAVAAMVMVMPSITLSNTSLPTAMLSHGLALGTLVLAVAPRSGWSRARGDTG